MSDEQIRELIAKRDGLKKWLREAETELSDAVGQWGRERGYLVKLTPEQALREMRVPS